ncbi:MAG TPA: SDR family NAD(P)-dependent oxidoreductase [Bacteroidales bacterium]|jgi:short-subunit dehydrogenase|nr:SDR family NAD(P)-dependent oxidoreductase [Bacteroidales bacterium]
MCEKVKHKTALISGASSGIGYQCADLLAQKGYDLIVIGKRAAKLEKAVQTLRQHPVIIYPLVLNLCEPDAAENVFSFCKVNHLHVDVLICNAGMNRVGQLMHTSPEEIIDILQLQTLNPSLLCRYFGREMKKKGGGHILIVSSLTAYTPFPTLSLYAASKRYLHSFSKAIAAELKPFNVKVTDLCPGGVETDFFDNRGKFILLAMRFGLMMNARKVAEKGLNAMFKGKTYITPGWVNCLLIYMIHLLPRFCVSWLFNHTSLFTNETDSKYEQKNKYLNHE